MRKNCGGLNVILLSLANSRAPLYILTMQRYTFNGGSYFNYERRREKGTCHAVAGRR
jgi:hypothetical protein